MPSRALHFPSAYTCQRLFPGRTRGLRLRKKPSAPAALLSQMHSDKPIYLEALSFCSSSLDWDTRPSCAWCVTLFFATVSDHEVSELLIQRRGWTALLKNFEVLFVLCSVANARTLQCHSPRIGSASPIQRFHRCYEPSQ